MRIVSATLTPRTGISNRKNTNEKVVGKMVRNALTKLTGKKTVAKSWDYMFRSHKMNKLNKNEGYVKGEKILIKINQGTSRLGLNNEEKENGFYYPKNLKPGEERRKSSFGATETRPVCSYRIIKGTGSRSRDKTGRYHCR